MARYEHLPIYKQAMAVSGILSPTALAHPADRMLLSILKRQSPDLAITLRPQAYFQKPNVTHNLI